MAAGTQARCLQMLEQATSMGTAARASILAAFTSGQGYSADADYGVAPHVTASAGQGAGHIARSSAARERSSGSRSEYRAYQTVRCSRLSCSHTASLAGAGSP